MTFTTTPPTVPGDYKIRHIEAKYETLAEVYLTESGRLAVIAAGEVHDLEDWHEYEWCRLVPAEEVDKAWNEGFDDGQRNFLPLKIVEANKSIKWEESRAKQVAEGTK